MKLLSDIKLSESEVKQQFKTNCTIQKINALMDISESLKDWEGMRKLELILEIENKLLGNEQRKGLIDEL
tara:strand:- start:15 stop:224 length:210 start_codon:yes stop_codon:yes gene_type:complete